MLRSRWILPLLVVATMPAFCQREPVLKQIDLPHPYYFREMYLPQLTTGPSAEAWMPDSHTLIYSMAGSSLAPGSDWNNGGATHRWLRI